MPTRRSLILVAILLLVAATTHARTICVTDGQEGGNRYRFDIRPACSARPAGKAPKVSRVHGIVLNDGALSPFWGTCLSLAGEIRLEGDSINGNSLEVSGATVGTASGPSVTLEPVDCKILGLK